MVNLLFTVNTSIMGGTRNLKRGGKRGGQRPGHRGNKFVWEEWGANVDRYSVVMCIKEM